MQDCPPALSTERYRAVQRCEARQRKTKWKRGRDTVCVACLSNVLRIWNAR